jgi:nucleoside-diphosphate-sugar epimerase
MRKSVCKAPVRAGKDGAITDLLEGGVIVINIPPGRRDPERQAKYAGWMKMLASRIAKDSYVVFASSTSVYPDDVEVADIDAAAPHSDGAAALLEAERAFQHHGGGCMTIRFGGLYGHERRPGRFFAGRKQIPGGDAPVNMIHRDDAVEILRLIVEKRPESGIINACAPRHPSRRDFYTEWARRDGLDLPTWEDSGGSGKRVLTRIPDELQFAFAYPDPMMPAP